MTHIDVGRQLILLAKAGDLAALQELLAQGVHPDTSGPNGYTALMMAAREGHTALVQALLAAGANPAATTVPTRFGPSHAAMTLTRHGPIIQLLLDAGADYPAVLPADWLDTPIDRAALARETASWHPDAYARWAIFIGMCLPTDTLWTFRTPLHLWGAVHRRAGYAIVHHRRPVRVFETGPR